MKVKLKPIEVYIGIHAPSFVKNPFVIGYADIKGRRVWVNLVRRADLNDANKRSHDWYAKDVARNIVHEVLHILINPEIAKEMERRKKMFATDLIIETLAEWSILKKVDIGMVISVTQEIEYVSLERGKELIDFAKK